MGGIDRAVDPQGRLIAANAELMALELMTNRTSAGFQSTALRLKQRLMDYDNPSLAAPQRRFLMKELQNLSPEKIEFPTLAAEELAAQFSARHPATEETPSWHAAFLPDVWQFTTPRRRAIALVRSEKLSARLQTARHR